jgi:hypothetical protein
MQGPVVACYPALASPMEKPRGVLMRSISTTLYLHALFRRVGGFAGHSIEEAAGASNYVTSAVSHLVFFVSAGSKRVRM